MSCSSCADKLIHDISKLFTEEYRNHGRRCLVATQSVIISHVCGRFTEQICMRIYCLENTGQDKQELNILMRCLARLQKIDAVICSQRPVIVLT